VKVVKRYLLKHFVVKLCCEYTSEEEIFVYKTTHGTQELRYNMSNELIEKETDNLFWGRETMVDWKTTMEHDWRVNNDGNEYIFQEDDQKVNIMDTVADYTLDEEEDEEWEGSVVGEVWGHKEQ